MKVTRSHAPTNITAVEDRLRNDVSFLPRLKQKMKERFKPSMLGNNFNSFHASVADAMLLKRSHQEIFELFVDAEEFGVANFLFSLKQGERHGVKLLGEHYELQGKPIRSYVDVGFWTKVMFYAMIRRDKEAITILKKVDKSVWSTTSLSGDVDFDFAYADLLKGLYTPGVDIAKLLESAMLAFDPEVIGAERLPSIGDVLFPVVRIIRTVFAPNGESEFNELMYEALKQHKQFYANKAFNLGALSFPLMAIAAYAFDQKGYRLTVESDFILPWLVEGDFDEMSQGPLPKRFDIPGESNEEYIMKFKTTQSSKEHYYSIGIEETTGKHFLSIPTVKRRIDASEFYSITAQFYSDCQADMKNGLKFADECRRREHDDLLMKDPGKDRGVAV